MIGFGLMLPVLPFYIERLALAGNSLSSASSVHVGALTGIFALMQFIFDPFWGRRSDRKNRRRPFLLIGLIGNILALIFFGISTNLYMLYAARILNGVFAATYLLYLAAVSAIAAVTSGYIASNGLGHEAPGHEFVHAHRDVMLWMTGVLLATALSVPFWKGLRVGRLRRLLIIPLLIASGLLVFGADRGGRLVFELGIGVKQPLSQPESPGSAVPDDAGTAQEHSDGHQHTH